MESLFPIEICKNCNRIGSHSHQKERGIDAILTLVMRESLNSYQLELILKAALTEIFDTETSV